MGVAKFKTGCPNCGVLECPEGFRKPHKSSRPWCNPCRREMERHSPSYRGSYQRYYAANKEKVSAKKRLKMYGITQEQYDAMVKDINGVCSLCRTKPKTKHRPWVLDHDHGCCAGEKTCGRCVRGLICQNCNKALGLVQDSVNTLLAMVAYLGKV